MPLLKDGKLIDDAWIEVSDGEDLPIAGPVIVSLARWQAEGDALRAAGTRLGLRLPNDADPDLIREDLGRFEVIALEFPTFADGRAYSQARILRERHGFTGELRATGNVLRDQLLYLHRCGFDAFTVAESDAPDQWQAAVNEFTVWFQPAADGRTPALALRHQRAAAE